jgi:hypothetical protein
MNIKIKRCFDTFYDVFMISVYRSPHSRKDILHSLGAPHEGDEEIIFPSNLIPSYMMQKNGKIKKKLGST